MKTSDFDYNLPQECIAQKPIEPRDHSRLMVLNRSEKNIEHHYFYELVDYLHTGDVLVLNNSRDDFSILGSQILERSSLNFSDNDFSFPCSVNRI